MGIKSFLTDMKSGKALRILTTNRGEVLAVLPPQAVDGAFKSAAFTAQTATTKIVEPIGDGSIELTDLIVAFEKKQNAVVTLRFMDADNNTETIWYADLTDGAINFAIPFKGNWKGWRGAYIDIVIATADADGSISIGYVHHDKAHSISYSEWDARR